MSSTVLTSASTCFSLHSHWYRHLVDKQVFKPLSLVKEVASSDHNSVSHSCVHTSHLVLLTCHSCQWNCYPQHLSTLLSLALLSWTTLPSHSCWLCHSSLYNELPKLSIVAAYIIDSLISVLTVNTFHFYHYIICERSCKDGSILCPEHIKAIAFGKFWYTWREYSLVSFWDFRAGLLSSLGPASEVTCPSLIFWEHNVCQHDLRLTCTSSV
jgi:hypothetical protein